MHAIQRALDDFRINLGGQRLAHPGRACAQHRSAAGLAGHDVIHQHIHLGGQDVDEIGLLRRQNQLLLQCRLVCVGRDVFHVHPQVVVQIEVEHEDVGMHRQLREQPLGHRGLGFADCRLRVVLIALRRLAQIRAEDVPGRFQRSGARTQDALVVDQPGDAAAARQHHHVFARPVGVAVGRGRVFGVKTDALAGELHAILATPVEIALCAIVVSSDQFGAFPHVSLGGENFRYRLVDNIGGGNAEGRRGECALGIGPEFKHYLAGIVVGRRNVVEAGDHIGQRFVRHVHPKQPATQGIRRQIAGDRRHQHFQIVVGTKAGALAVERLLQRDELRRAGAHGGTGFPVEIAEKTQFDAGELVERHRYLVAEAQLILKRREAREFRDHGLDIRPLNLKIHGLVPLTSADGLHSKIFGCSLR